MILVNIFYSFNMSLSVILAILAIGLPTSIFIAIIYFLTRIAVISEQTRELVQENEVDINNTRKYNENAQRISSSQVP